jgi:succinyl-diaminopimelate desuccinylase
VNYVSLSAVEERVLSKIKEEDVIELSRKLISIPSETGKEKRVGEFVADEMRKLGLEVKFEGEKDRPNVLGTLRGTRGSPVISYGAHLDTVPPGDPKKWIADPYSGKVIDGKIYGRGAMDSKGGGVAATLSAVKAIVDSKVKLNGNVVLVATVDEEVGGPAGSKLLIEQGHLRPDIHIYCVHSDLEIKGYLKGITWVKLKVRGQTAHGSMPHMGVNAISKTVKILSELERVGPKYKKHSVLGDGTYNFGWIHAGPDYKYNVIPDYCETGIDFRLVPGQTPDGIVKQLQEIVASLKANDPQMDAEVEMVQSDPPHEIPSDDPAIRLISESAKKVLGVYPKITGTIAAGDLAPLFKKGLKGIGFGPGDLERGRAHKENEFLEVDQLVKAAKIYAVSMLNGCGVAE